MVESQNEVSGPTPKGLSAGAKHKAMLEIGNLQRKKDLETLKGGIMIKDRKKSLKSFESTLKTLNDEVKIDFVNIVEKFTNTHTEKSLKRLNLQLDVLIKLETLGGKK